MAFPATLEGNLTNTQTKPDPLEQSENYTKKGSRDFNKVLNAAPLASVCYMHPGKFISTSLSSEQGEL